MTKSHELSLKPVNFSSYPEDRKCTVNAAVDVPDVEHSGYGYDPSDMGRRYNPPKVGAEHTIDVKHRLRERALHYGRRRASLYDRMSAGEKYDYEPNFLSIAICMECAVQSSSYQLQRSIAQSLMDNIIETCHKSGYTHIQTPRTVAANSEYSTKVPLVQEGLTVFAFALVVCGIIILPSQSNKFSYLFMSSVTTAILGQANIAALGGNHFPL
uniref:Uncharacterized protein n=1 Tax=Psilocybe cubensis TaxID=181762 RepID=A0A8H7XIS9_PSICU